MGSPRESLPSAMVTAAELEGAYRFFNNDDVSFDELLEAHSSAVAERAAGRDVVLAIHDTTTCSFPHAAWNTQVSRSPTSDQGASAAGVLCALANVSRRLPGRSRSQSRCHRCGR